MATNPQKIVDQLLTLSSDPENQAYIVRESGTLPDTTLRLHAQHSRCKHGVRPVGAVRAAH